MEAWPQEDAPLLAARQRAQEVGIEPVSAAVGATLRMLAAAAGARAVVEVGTGTGVSGLWLLRGMAPEGVLTSIDSEAEHQRLARQTFTEAGIAPARTRLIAGAAAQVLPRLSDGGYDLVLCDAALVDLDDQLTEALRLLRPGGLVVLARTLRQDRVGDSAARDPETVALRELSRTVREHPRLVPALLPVGQGLLVAVTLPPE